MWEPPPAPPDTETGATPAPIVDSGAGRSNFMAYLIGGLVIAAMRMEGLSQAERQWAFLDLALSGTTAPERGRSDVFGASEMLLTVMERVTRLYADVLG